MDRDPQIRPLILSNILVEAFVPTEIPRHILAVTVKERLGQGRLRKVAGKGRVKYCPSTTSLSCSRKMKRGCA